MSQVWDNVSNELKLKSKIDRECVRKVILSVLLFNDQKEDDLNENEIKAIIALTRGYFTELVKVRKDPDSYNKTLIKMKRTLGDRKWVLN